ncbi:MAG: hypothetical protein FWC12_05835 [Treponema sp.]|nr:hypothetical protein [Treponema sp.]
MKITRILLAAIILIVVTFTGFTQVNREELEDLPPVVFINYEGPYTRMDTWEEIRQLGVVLGNVISEREGSIAPTLNAMTLEQRRNHTYRFDAGPNNRFFVIHCISGQEEGKIDSDIFGLGVDTGVDHVRNLRLIIRGYLQTAYNYSANDAALLAEFITVYNAVYRGDWDYFVSRYKTQVISNLTRDKAGLSIRYDEWPGRTLILIPLGQGRGLSSIDTSVITDSRVIEEMRREDDQSVPQRQQMVNLVEREAAQAERQAQTERQAIRQEERQVTEERRQTEQARQQVEEDRSAGKITEEQARQAEAVIEKKEEELAKREENLEERREAVQQLEEFAEKKTVEAQQQREEIARDQQAVIVQETTGGVFGVTIEKQIPPIQVGRVVRLNPADGSEIRRSPLDTTHVRTVTFIGGRIIAIAGENKGNGAVRLVDINQTNLEMAKQGDDDIQTGSLLWVNGNDLYAITADLKNNQCFLGRFNTNLIMEAKSAVRVHPEAGVSIQQGRLLTQRPDGSAMVLNPTDLTEIK